jgi:hypothetical protein
MMKFLKSKTVWAGLIAGVPHILQQFDALASTGLLGPKVQGISLGVGIILGAVGVKHAADKSGPTK